MAFSIPYPSIEQLGVIGDRRTAGLIGADGTLSWLCLPHYDQPPVFAAILDARQGGHWRIGPLQSAYGRQHYVSDTAALVTQWNLPAGELELTDLMLSPEDHRPHGQERRHAVLRRLRCLSGNMKACMHMAPRRDFQQPFNLSGTGQQFEFNAASSRLMLWTTFSSRAGPAAVAADLCLTAGDEHWAILEDGGFTEVWTPERAREAFDATLRYWDDWMDQLTYIGPRRAQIRRTAMLVHLLDFTPTGALVAAPTSSLPERIGGDRNYDYRFAWIRDASLSLATQALLGIPQYTQRYMDWLDQLGSSTDAPLQPVYTINGSPDLQQTDRADIAGYRESAPVRMGNHAHSQNQINSFGFLAECSWIYLEQGGTWKDSYWQLLRRIADYVAAHWQQPQNGIWELPGTLHQYVSGKVMSWVTLDRVIRIAGHLHLADDTAHWQQQREAIHAEVMEKGWSEQLRAFRQHYDADGLDADSLLIPIFGFLPATHPRVLATIERIQERLVINHFVYRFDPQTVLGQDRLPLGEFEGAFLPATFWMASALALAGRPDEAEHYLESVEAVSGETGLLAEEVDARDARFLGNLPLLFSHVTYAHAVLAIAKAHPFDRMLLKLGEVERGFSHSPNSEV